MAGGNGLIYLGLGAAIMYLMDPQNGRKRRADLKNQVDAAARKVREGQRIVVRDATNRAHGLISETRRWVDTRRQQRETGVAANDSGGGQLLSNAMASVNG